MRIRNRIGYHYVKWTVGNPVVELSFTQESHVHEESSSKS